MAETDYSTTRAAADYIQQSPDDPFFLSVGLYNTHRPFPTDDLTVDPDHVQPPAPLPDVPEVRRDMAAYATLARFVDDRVGHVLHALRESGVIDETVVIFTTDHGIVFPYMKCNLFEGGIGVSLITRFSDGPRGKVSDSLVSQIDLFPTFCESLELEAPDYVEGTSVMPQVQGEKDSVRDEAFSEVTYYAAYEPKRCIRTDRYKYIRRFQNGLELWS